MYLFKPRMLTRESKPNNSSLDSFWWPLTPSSSLGPSLAPAPNSPGVTTFMFLFKNLQMWDTHEAQFNDTSKFSVTMSTDHEIFINEKSFTSLKNTHTSGRGPIMKLLESGRRGRSRFDGGHFDNRPIVRHHRPVSSSAETREVLFAGFFNVPPIHFSRRIWTDLLLLLSTMRRISRRNQRSESLKSDEKSEIEDSSI